MATTVTREKILDSAQAYAQSRGFNAFSYADIAEDVGVRKASIHHHFPSKDDLLLELLTRYRETFMSELRNIERKNTKCLEVLKKYAALYAATLRRNQICLGGMMASDIGALSSRLTPSLQGFFTEQREWLTSILSKGKSNGDLVFSGTAEARAAVFLAGLQGGLLMANTLNDENFFKHIQSELISELQ